jgi:hypothetical protein
MVIRVVILAEIGLRREYGLKKMSGPDMAYGRWMAAACTMTVMRRGLWKQEQRGDGHKSIKSVCMDTAVLLYHHSPRPASSLSSTNLIIYFPY